MTVPNYPDIFKWVKAVIIDFFLLFMLVLVVMVFAPFENIPVYARIIAFLIIFVLYNSLLVSAFGDTLGHKLMGMKVKENRNPELNILFHRAVMRFLVKAFLGWLSLITVTGNEKKRAIHDLLVG